jgi:acetyl-CoA carboxylase biotin carboxyl carrier protein
VEDVTKAATELADLMDEFRLGEAKLETEDYEIKFRRTPKAPKGVAMIAGAAPSVEATSPVEEDEEEPTTAAVPKGIPVNSPMTGIYYGLPSPTAPPFVKEGDTVQAGQVVALVEAMKVFNEINAPIAGTVTRIMPANGAMVNPGEPILYIS